MNSLPITILWLVLSMARVDIADPKTATPPRLHVFSGQTANIELAVETPGTSPLEIQADLFQKGQSLLAPLQKDIVVAQGVRSENPPTSRPLVTWSLAVPEAKRPCEMLARLRVKSGPGEWMPAGQILLSVYPKDFAGEQLTALAKDRELHVFGGNKNLRAFLKAQKADFDDATDDLPSLPQNPAPKDIFIGQATTQEFTDWLAAHPGWQGSLVVFCPDSPALPGVFVTTGRGSRIVKVTLPVLGTLSTDPRSQETFIDILKSATAP